MELPVPANTINLLLGRNVKKENLFMIILKEHPYEFQIKKAFNRLIRTPQKVAYFELRCNYGILRSFNKIKNIVSKALIVSQHGKRPPTIIKLETPLQGEENQLKLIISPEKNEIAIYVKSGSHEFAEYFHPKYSPDSRLWAMFELHGGIYGILFDSKKYRMDFGFHFMLDDYSPNPFDVMSMGLTPTFLFDGETIPNYNSHKNDKYAKKIERNI